MQISYKLTFSYPNNFSYPNVFEKQEVWITEGLLYIKIVFVNKLIVLLQYIYFYTKLH